MSNQTIYITKKQLNILAIALMSFTRDDKAFEYAIFSGAIEEDDVYEYIETIQKLVKTIPDQNGVLIVSELGKKITEDCIDFWGNPVNQ
jgi:hypothetical protein